MQAGRRALVAALVLLPLVFMISTSDLYFHQRNEAALGWRRAEGAEDRDHDGPLDATIRAPPGLPAGLEASERRPSPYLASEIDTSPGPQQQGASPGLDVAGQEGDSWQPRVEGLEGGRQENPQERGAEAVGPGAGGAADKLQQPPDPVFYTSEAGVELRLRDAPEDPFSEDMRRWLPAPDELPGALGRCAVVGNSATLRGAGNGAGIDAADAVIRVNQAPSGGKIAADVGSRTTMRLLNMKWTEIYSSPSAKDWGRASVVHSAAAARLVEADAKGSAWLVSARTRGVILARLASRKDAAEQYRRPSPLLLRWVHNSLAAFAGGDEMQAQPSTGLMAVFLAIRLCSDVQVFGFSGQVCRGAQHCNKAAHYWSAQGNWIDADRLVTHPAHKFSLEGRLLCELEKGMPPRGITGLNNATVQVHWDGSGPPQGCH